MRSKHKKANIETKFKTLIICIIGFILLAGCSDIPNELKIAEKLIYTSPDSALHILKSQHFSNYNSPSNKALYGLLLYMALDNTDNPMQPDSLINFSIDYYSKKNEQQNLAKCYYIKGRKLRKQQLYEEATMFFIKSHDLINSNEDHLTTGRIYLDMGDILSFQINWNGAYKKYQNALTEFRQTNNVYLTNYTLMCLGRTYSLVKSHKKAHFFYNIVLKRSTDSITNGLIYQELGINFSNFKQYDSAKYNLRKSLKYPYKGTNYAIRCYCYSDLLFQLNQFDSSAYYAKKALNYPANFVTTKELYRILTNYEYIKNDLKQMGHYMSLYQNYTDSIRKVENQTKLSDLENLHKTTQETDGTKRNMIYTTSILLAILLISCLISYIFYLRFRRRKEQLDIFKQELSSKQEFVNQTISKKIEEVRASQSELRKKSTPDQRNQLDKELYEKSLHLNNWDIFACEMNHAFNQIVDVLESDFVGVTQKEIIWCCLDLLNVPNADRITLLDATSASLYKLKQRLAQKLNLNSTKELNSFLRELAKIEN
jgi:hypothetical protein